MLETAPLPRRLRDAWGPLARQSNLAFALGFVPKARRDDLRLFYTFCRQVDDVADSPSIPEAMKRDGLETWLEGLEGKIALPEDLEQMLATHAIDRRLLREIVLGVRMDLEQQRYGTFEELRRYCWRVASAVGLVSLQLFGCPRRDGDPYAENLGLALQLTNILRDVREDAEAGRIYLPREDLDRFGVPETDLLEGRHSLAMARLFEFQRDRAQEFYRRAALAFPGPYGKELAAAEAMRGIYFSILEEMARDGYRVFEKRYGLPLSRKIWIGLKARLGIRPPTPGPPASS